MVNRQLYWDKPILGANGRPKKGSAARVFAASLAEHSIAEEEREEAAALEEYLSAQKAAVEQLLAVQGEETTPAPASAPASEPTPPTQKGRGRSRVAEPVSAPAQAESAEEEDPATLSEPEITLTPEEAEAGVEIVEDFEEDDE